MIRRILPPLCLALLGFGPAPPAAAADPIALRDSVPHIATVGQASATVVPDQADIRLGISNERPSADAATAATAAQATKVVDAIKAQGIAAADIASSFSLAAQYDTVVDPQTRVSQRKLRGYSAATEITVRLREIARVGGLLRMLIDEGANSVQGVDYSYSKERELERRLDGEAAKDAEVTAHATVDALGLTLGRVLQIDPDTPVEPPVRRFATKAMFESAADVALPMEPGTQRITRRVAVIFEIEGKAR